MPILDPREFWGKDSEITAKMSSESVFRKRFAYPPIKNNKGELVFRIIADAISKVAKEEFVKGYVDLDTIWANHPQLKQYRDQLFAQYPKPFNGFKLWYGRIQIKEITEDVENPTTKLKEKKTRIGICDKIGNGWKLSVQICIFRNIALGWNQDWEKPPKITTKHMNPNTGALEIVEEEPNPDDVENFKPTWKFKGISGFISNDLMIRVEGFVEQCYKKGESLPKELSVLVIGQNPTTKDEKYWNMDIGDVL